MKKKNKQILKVTALYVILNLEICQNPPTCGQDDLVLLRKKLHKKTVFGFQKWNDKYTNSGINGAYGICFVLTIISA